MMRNYYTIMVFETFWKRSKCQSIKNKLLLKKLASRAFVYTNAKMPAQFSGCTGIFLVGEVPNPLKDPYLAIRDCAFVPERFIGSLSLVFGNLI